MAVTGAYVRLLRGGRGAAWMDGGEYACAKLEPDVRLWTRWAANVEQLDGCQGYLTCSVLIALRWGLWVNVIMRDDWNSPHLYPTVFRARRLRHSMLKNDLQARTRDLVFSRELTDFWCLIWRDGRDVNVVVVDWFMEVFKATWLSTRKSKNLPDQWYYGSQNNVLQNFGESSDAMSYVKLVHVGHCACLVRHHVTMLKWTVLEKCSFS